jgi:hypothetical protein
MGAAAPAQKNAAAPWFQTTHQNSARSLAYAHSVTLAMPHAAIRRHFDAARDQCLQDQTFGCVLINAEFQAGAPTVEDDGDISPSSANLQLRLPADKIARFANGLTTPLPGEPAGTVAVVSQTTSAQDLAVAVADVARRLAQLADYRDRLAALAKRADINADSLIKIAHEMSSVQSDIESAEGEQRGLALRIDTETLEIVFNERAPAASNTPLKPVIAVWSESTVIFGRSLASALEFVIGAVPWLPIIGFGLALGRFVWRFLRKPRRSGSSTVS